MPHETVIANGSSYQNIKGLLDSTTLQEVAEKALENAWENLQKVRELLRAKHNKKLHEVTIVHFNAVHTVNTFPTGGESNSTTIVIVYTIQASLGIAD